MIREHRGSLKVEKRLDGAVWVLRLKVIRDSDHKRVETTRVIGRVQDFPTKTQAFAEAECLRLYTVEPGSKRGTLIFAILAEFYLQELKKVPESKKRRPKAASTVQDRQRIIRKRLLPRFGETEALKIKPSEIKAWLEIGAVPGRLRKFDGGQIPPCDAPGLLDCTDQRPDPKHGRSESGQARSHHNDDRVQAILVTPQEAWNIIYRMQAFARLLILLVAVTGLKIGEVLAIGASFAFTWSPTSSAEFLSVTCRRALDMARSGHLPAHPTGSGRRRTWRFLLSQHQEHIRSGGGSYKNVFTGGKSRAMVRARVVPGRVAN
jgi:hypothetical protein